MVCLAHGSRDARHRTTVASIAEAVRVRRPGLDVRVAFLDHDAPRVPDVLAGQGGGPAVLVPLLLGNAFHGRVDVPSAVAAALRENPSARVRLAAVLGPDRALLAALEARLAEAGAAADPATGVVLAAAGTSDPRARAALERLGRCWRPGGRPVTVAYASGPGPSPGEAVAAALAAGARRVAVAPWFLAPGVLLDRARAEALEAGAQVSAAALGPAPEVLEVVLRRYDAAAGACARRVARPRTACASAA